LQQPDIRQRQQRQQSGNRKIGNVINDGEIDQKTKGTAGNAKQKCLVASIFRRVGVIFRMSQLDIANDLLFEFIDAYDYDSVRTLLEQGLEVSPRSQLDYTPLHLAVEKRFASMVELLLRYGADPGAPGLKLSLTPLHLVSDIYSALALVEHGAKLDAYNLFGNPPLHHACLQGKVDGVVALLNCGAGLYSLNANGQTAPYLAVMAPENSLVLLTLFKLAGYSYQSRNNSYTLLHHCAAHLKYDLIPWLLREGADIEARDEQGMDVADYLRNMEQRVREEKRQELYRTRQALGI
jgi:ankyrin repeat protein